MIQNTNTVNMIIKAVRDINEQTKQNEAESVTYYQMLKETFLLEIKYILLSTGNEGLVGLFEQKVKIVELQLSKKQETEELRILYNKRTLLQIISAALDIATIILK